MKHKFCHKCKETKPVSAFSKSAERKDGLQVYCRDCHRAYKRHDDYNKRWYARNAEEQRETARAYYRENTEDRKQYARKYREQNPERVSKSRRQAERKRKMAAFDAYGGRACKCCGETILTFLTIDHINGCSPEKREEQGLGSGLYSWLKKHNYPPGFQVLCFNCNLGRQINGGICPHREKPLTAI